MDIHRLAFWLDDLVAPIREIDGRLFIDRDGLGEVGLRSKIAGFASITEAQHWMNIVFIESFIDEIAGSNWEPQDDQIGRLLNIYREAWTHQIRASYPEAIFRIQDVIGADYEDIGIRIVQD